MKKNKLLIFFKSFKNSELKLVGAYLESPFSKGSPLVINLFKYLKKSHPNFNQKEIDKNAVFNKIWPNETFNNKRLLNLSRKLCIELEQFISIQNQQGNEINKRLFLAKSKHIQQNKKLFLANTAKWKKAINLEKDNSHKYHQLMEFHELNLNFCLSDNYCPNNEHFLAVKENLDLFYYSYRLKISCEEYSQAKMFTLKKSYAKDIRALLEQTHQFESNAYPLLHIYRSFLIFLYEKPNENAFSDILDLLKKYSDKIQKEELQDLFMTLGKFCIQQRMQGNNSYLVPHLDLYKWGLEQKIMTDGNTISSSNFLNIVFVATAAKEEVYAKEFILSYFSKIQKEEKYDTTILALAQYRYATGAFQKSIQLIDKVSSRFERYRLRIQYMQIKIYYEQFASNPFLYFDDLEAKIVSCFQFFKTEKKISENRRQSFFALLRFVRKMKIAHLKNDKSIKGELLDLIKKEDVVYRPWLLEHIQLLP